MGINTFFKLGVKNLKNVDSFKIKNKQSAYFIFPDFVSNICDVNNKKIKNCCVELKVSIKRIERLAENMSYNAIITQLKVENLLS